MATVISRVLNLGCGLAADLSEGVINVDCVPLPGVSMVWDLDDHPWPWESAGFAEVRAIQVFEHLADPVAFMVDAHRVLAPGGLLALTTPYYRSDNAFTDPTHRRFCTLRSWDYWIAGTPLWAQFNAAYGGVSFERELVILSGDEQDILVRLRRPT